MQESDRSQMKAGVRKSHEPLRERSYGATDEMYLGRRLYYYAEVDQKAE